MSLNQIEKLARKLLNKHGLEDWRFCFHKGKVTYGYCYNDKKIIKLSNHLCVTNPHLIKEILLHEIAHALCPTETHGKRWKETAQRIGATGEARYEIKGC